MAKIILKTEGLTKHYGGIHALVDADFEIKEGEHIAIVGDNGAGKSTFVRQITGVEQRSGGRVWFDGVEVRFAGAGGSGRAPSSRRSHSPTRPRSIRARRCSGGWACSA